MLSQITGKLPWRYKTSQYLTWPCWKCKTIRLLFYQGRQDCLWNCYIKSVFDELTLPRAAWKGQAQAIWRFERHLLELDVRSGIDHALSYDLWAGYGVLWSSEIVHTAILPPQKNIIASANWLLPAVNVSCLGLHSYGSCSEANPSTFSGFNRASLILSFCYNN